jgi:hypothetical protein
MKKQTADPVRTLDGIIFTKEVSATNTRVEGFYKNSVGTYQFIPSYKSGSVLLNTTSSFHTLTDVPNNSYGYIYMYTATDADDMGMGFFKAAGGKVQAYTIPVLLQDANYGDWFFRFGNGSNASGLNIRVKKPNHLATDTYNYKIVYWGL